MFLRNTQPSCFFETPGLPVSSKHNVWQSGLFQLLTLLTVSLRAQSPANRFARISLPYKIHILP